MATAKEFAITNATFLRRARVLTEKPWSANDSLVIKSLEGDLQSEARVIYRQPIRENVDAIGLELLAPKGNWLSRLAGRIQLFAEILEGITHNPDAPALSPIR